MATKKVTIIFPPGDILTSVVWEKEKDTKLVDLLSRLCQLRGLALDKLKAYTDEGKKLKEEKLQQTVEESGLLFLELLEKGNKRDKKPKEINVNDDDFDDKQNGIPKTIKDKIVPGSFVDIPLREQLFDHEWEILQKFKTAHADLCSNYSDEFVMACLFGRKLDMERAHALLQNNFKFRKEKGFMNIPKLSEIDVRGFTPYMAIHGSRSKQGNTMTYLRIAEQTPGIEPHTISGLQKWMAWYNYVGVFADGMDGARNGILLIADFEGMGWKNFDVEFNRTNASLWQDVFPGRPRKFFVLNEPLIFTAVFKIMQTFLKAKMAARFQTITPAELTKYVDKDHLSTKFGGTLTTTHDQYIDTLKAFAAKHEDRLIAAGRT